MPDNNETLLKAIFSMVARQAIPPQRVAKIVMAKGAGAKHRAAYNLCDGTRTQADIVKALKLQQGNFSRLVSRWIEAGIVIRLGEGRETMLLHVYPLHGATETSELKASD